MTTPEAVADGARHRGGRPRDTAAEQRILTATVALLATVGYEGTTIEAVAAHARVGRPTIYRRWASREALMVAALAQAFTEANPIAPRTADVRADLTTLLGNLIDLLATPIGAVIRALISATDHAPALRVAVSVFERQRRELLIELLSRAAEVGTLRAGITPSLGVDFVLGPIYFRLLVSRDPLDRAFVEAIVEAILIASRTGGQL